ncbi:hypothetical protein ACIPLR_26585, partial [Herbaspirillum huttiense]
MQFNTMLKTIPALLIGATLSSAALAADIKLGVAEALTGPAAKYGVAIKNGFTLASEEINAKGDVDFKAQLTKIKAGNPDAIVCSCLAEEAANIILQTRAHAKMRPNSGPVSITCRTEE